MLITFFANDLLAQDSIRIEQYCELKAGYKLFSDKVEVHISFGQPKSINWKGNIIGRDFNSIIDALNFMGFNGWVLVNAFPKVGDSSGIETRYVMKRSCLKTEIVTLKQEMEKLIR